MAVEWLIALGVKAATSDFTKSVLQDLAKDFAKDEGKNFVSKAAKRVAKKISPDDFNKLYAKAIAELVETIHQELQTSGLAKDNIDVYAKDLEKFLLTESLQEALPEAFASSAGKIEGDALKRGWKQLPDLAPLPPEFDWDYVAETFNRKLRKLRTDDADFRAVSPSSSRAPKPPPTPNKPLGVQPDFELRGYRDALLERYANLHFDMMDTSGANYDGVKLWKVFVPQTVRESREYLPQLHEIPKEHLRRMVASGELDAKDAAMVREMTKELIEERQRTYLDQSPRSVSELAADDRLMRMVILGDPGAGKSSWLQHLALEWARLESAEKRESLALPLLIELKEYDRWDCPNGKSFLRYLHDAQTWHRLNQLDLEKRLKSTKQPTVLLLDGLDEVFDLARRTQVVNDIHYFSNQYPQIRIIVTSRIIGYKPQRLADAEFSHFILQDLDEAQINDFLDRWHNTTFKNTKDAEAKKARLSKAINDSSAIRELAGNPLLLTMMAILNRNQELPRERIQLYEQASRLLLHQWDTERALDSHPQLKGHVGPKEKAEMLREIAYAMQSAGEGLAGNLINEDELEAMLSRYLKVRT
jgi:predicted NACHT family NTPase